MEVEQSVSKRPRDWLNALLLAKPSKRHARHQQHGEVFLPRVIGDEVARDEPSSNRPRQIERKSKTMRKKTKRGRRRGA